MVKSLHMLIEWVYPTGCVICGRECTPAPPICTTCHRRLPFFDFPICPICGDFTRQRRPHRECTGSSPGAVSLFWFAGLFDAGYRPLVHALKYERQLSIGEFFGQRIGRLLASQFSGGENAPLVVPVPLHPSREKKRGYNQSGIIAAGVARATGYPLGEGLIARIRKTKDQTKLSPHKRVTNVRGAFAVRRPGTFRGRQVILVDDVLTTGATVNECARVIHADDADDVQVLVIALARPPGVKA